MRELELNEVKHVSGGFIGLFEDIFMTDGKPINRTSITTGNRIVNNCNKNGLSDSAKVELSIEAGSDLGVLGNGSNSKISFKMTTTCGEERKSEAQKAAPKAKP